MHNFRKLLPQYLSKSALWSVLYDIGTKLAVHFIFREALSGH